MTGKKAAFAAIVGRPSSGKSTFLNRVCGEKVAITSDSPQTTRNAIRGIVNRGEGQIVFIDTPGRHNSERKFNKRLLEVSDRAVIDCDLVLYLIDASRPPGPEEDAVAQMLKPLAEKTVAAVNKIDVPGCDVMRSCEFVSARLPSRIFQISAKTGEGVDALLSGLFSLAPDGEPFYEGDYYTDQETGFRIAEIIRGQAINRLRQELPHCLYVEIADAEFNESEQKLSVRAFIVVERESQKGMVVGAGGAMIKAIRLSSLKELKEIFDWKIELDLRVKTGKGWRHNDRILGKITG
jgi:GTP-binding protein Era